MHWQHTSASASARNGLTVGASLFTMRGHSFARKHTKCVRFFIYSSLMWSDGVKAFAFVPRYQFHSNEENENGFYFFTHVNTYSIHAMCHPLPLSLETRSTTTTMNTTTTTGTMATEATVTIVICRIKDVGRHTTHTCTRGIGTGVRLQRGDNEQIKM